MLTLAAILDEAENGPFLNNVTVLSFDQFRTIRAPSSPAFRARLDSALVGSDDLLHVQRVSAKEGLEVIEPVRAGIHGGYWYLRNIHRGETLPAGDCHYRSIVEALQAAIEWWDAEKWCRGVVLRTYEINHVSESLRGAV